MSSVVSQFELRPDELKLDDLYSWLEVVQKGKKKLERKKLEMGYKINKNICKT